ncbi:methylosome protein 50-like [Zootermopsis nevadensis]|uniref:Methylosome protein 50 n=1 Tax=Zootermopsis nevadensis TaxID=136037 RepID=A0A067RJA8_ZOONE|nr:methylosome protein 50-like [Zootermopsis nevadensis]KDR20539.1 Methylosome protein 50 [Zootermopsis nevadensis]
METVCVEVEPNRNAEAYRNYQPAGLPVQVEKHLDFIELCDDGFMLLGCSNLTGRLWTGSVWYFLDPDSAPNVEKCLTGIECETGVSDGKFLEDKQKIIIGEDSGLVQVLGLSESADEHTFRFESLNSVCEHDDGILSVSVFSDRTRALTGGSDMNIKVWSVESLTSEHTYRPAHLHQVSCVCAHPQDGSSIFASCSLDGMAFIWDTRNAKPAKVALCDGSQELTAVAWQMSRSDMLAIGSRSGEVIIADIRQLKEPLGVSDCFTRPVHRLRFAHHRPELLAVCADDSKVKVLDCTARAPNIIYADDHHSDFVRGLAWHSRKGTLYSCGWDKQVLAHKLVVSPNKMEVNGIIEEKDQELK